VPIRRFRSVEEMSEPPWREPGTAELWRAIEAVWAFGARTGVHRFPPGVYRHRTVESLNALTETWAQANFRAFREARALEPADLERSRSEQPPKP
jgi:hypothetical protein